MEISHPTMEETLRAHIDKLIGLYCANLGLGPSTVARLMFGSGEYFFGVQGRRKQTSFRVATYDQIVARFSEHWPSGLPWPAEIPRIDVRNVPNMPERKPHKPRGKVPPTAGEQDGETGEA